MKESNRYQQHEPFNILLVGDACIDEYQYGYVHRISPEAPVPIFNFIYTEEKPGMVLNVYNNLSAFNTTITLIRPPDPLSRKIRLVDSKTKCHIIRIDKDIICKESLQDLPVENSSYDAVVVSDYDKGFITYETIDYISENFKCLKFIDTKKKDLARIKDFYIKINEHERNLCTSLCDSSRLIITLGSRGAVYNNINYPGVSVEVTDVCGAGDTFLSSLVYFTLAKGSIKNAIPYANQASSITVKHIGTYAPKLEEIYAA